MLTEDEVLQLHTASLDVLERTGISTNSKRIIEVLTHNGAEFKADTGLLKIPSNLVKEALKTAPKEIHLYGRSQKNEMVLERGRVHFGFGGTPLHQILDMETGKSRASTKADVANATRLGDALPNLAFMMAICGATDAPHETEHLHELEVVFANTEKHIVWALPEAHTARKAIAMAAAVAGGVEELKTRPLLSCYSESISPLTFSTMNEDLVEFAAAGLPVFFTGCPMAGLTGPATLSGTYTLGNGGDVGRTYDLSADQRGDTVHLWSRNGRLRFEDPPFQLRGTRMGHGPYYSITTRGIVSTADIRLGWFFGFESRRLAGRSGSCIDGTHERAQRNQHDTLQRILSRK